VNQGYEMYKKLRKKRKTTLSDQKDPTDLLKDSIHEE
jgi:hypothetical protein